MTDETNAKQEPLAVVKRVEGIRPHGDNLTIVTVGDNEVVANRKEDGSFRWEPGEVVVYLREGAIIPLETLAERGYTDENGKGLLGGSKGNRVKMRRFAGVESRGLLFKLEPIDNQNYRLTVSDDHAVVREGDDVSEFLGLSEA